MKIELKVRKYDFSSTSRYVVRVPSSDKRKRVFFETKSEGLAYVRKLKARLNKEGDAALTLPESVRVEAGLCSGRLLPFGKTITDDVRLRLMGCSFSDRSVRPQGERLLKLGSGAGGKELAEAKVLELKLR